MMDIDSPSSHPDNIASLRESPTFTASLRSNSFGLNLSNNLKRPLIHKKGTTFSNNCITNDFSFSTHNKENNFLSSNNFNANNTNNALYKSFTFNGNPTISKKASVKKQMKKKSSSNLFRTSQNTLCHGHTLNHSHSNNHGHNRSSSHSHKHTKSNSSISSNSIFKNLSAKPSIDSIFNFSQDTQSVNLNNKSIFSQSNSTFIVSPTSNLSTPNGSENDSYYSSDENISDNEEHSEGHNIILADESFENDDESDNSNLDFGSPLQKKQSNRNKLLSNISHFKLQRHQSLMQFGVDGKNVNQLLSNQNYKFDTDQLASNINGLSVNSDDDEAVYGNSVLHDVPFEFSSNEYGKIPRITVDEFKKILHEYKNKNTSTNGKFCKHFDKLIVVDCRFKFEFKGGHIDGAINISSFTELESIFFTDAILSKTPVEFNENERALLIFHCEFSSHRGPMKADQLRYFDRSICGNFYPNLYYPDIVVLEGGYKDYYESEKSLHKSLSYIEMDNPLFKDERERNLTLLRRESSLSRKNSRNSSSVSLSRKTSHSSIKSINSSSILDFSSVNKVEFNQTLKPRPSKRFLPNANSSSTHSLLLNNNNNISGNEIHKMDIPPAQEQSDDFYSSSLSASTEYGLFGGFGNHKIDLDHLVDEDDKDTDTDSVPIFEDKGDSLRNILRTSKIPYSGNEGFKVPLPRPKFNRRGSLHLRSNTVSSFSFSNHSGFNSVPLLSTPEKAEAKFANNVFFRHNNSSVYSVQEGNESDPSNGNEYKSIYSSKYNDRHCDTPIKGKQ